MINYISRCIIMLIKDKKKEKEGRYYVKDKPNRRKNI
nr:MAG TPA: hypothetical protein [Caudoviricetes sp.]